MSEPTDLDSPENQDHRRQFEARMAAASAAMEAENGPSGKSRALPKITRSAQPFDREAHGKDGVIDVHFDGTTWCIDDESLDKPLQFSHLADAEQRASELSKDTGRHVCVRGQEGELVDSFDSDESK